MCKRNIWIPLMVLILLISSTIACGGSNEGVIVEPEEQTNTVEEDVSEVDDTPAVDENETAETLKDIYQLGDTIRLDDHTIRLNSVDYQGTILVANFTVINEGESDLGVSSFLSFSAKKSDGTKLEQDIFDCTASGLDGSVLPGDRLTGDICWSPASPDDQIKIYYEASLFGQGAVVWNATEGAAESLVPDEQSSSIQTFQVGDIIEVKFHTIRLNSVSYAGNILQTNFTIENNGTEDLPMSSMMSFTAKRQDGTVLEQEFFDCASGGLDNSILPNDRLTGHICWSTASPEDNIRLYYEASMFSEGAVVWDATEGEAEPIEYAPASLLIDINTAGTTVEMRSHTIILNSAVFNGNILRANFTLENQGDEDLEVSSMLLFSAKRQDGTLLEDEYFNCGSSLDGSVIPGDLLRGDVCWKGANPEDGIRLYYTPDWLGGSTAVWSVE